MRAVLEEVLTEQAYAGMTAHAEQLATRAREIIARNELPWHVTQIGGATGSMLSLFPPENATGNYVKVVQRVPVRIDLDNLPDQDKDHILRPGLSVEPTVRVKE